MAFIRSANKLRVLLTGGSGFIGSHVADQFLAHGWEVVILGRTSEMRHSSTREVKLIQGMVGDRALLEQIFSMGINGVIHLACSTVPGNF